LEEFENAPPILGGRNTCRCEAVCSQEVSIEFSCASSVCLRFLAERFSADGTRVRSQVEHERAEGQPRRGSSPVCHHFPQNEGKKRRNSGQRGISAPSLIHSSVMPRSYRPRLRLSPSRDEPLLKPQWQGSTSVSSPRPVPSWPFSSPWPKAQFCG
jgi:hypothetical protein